MKLGMDVMSWYYHVVVKIGRIGTDFGISFCKPKLLSRRLVVLRGNMSPLSAKRYTLPPLEFLNKGNIELH